MNKKCLAFSKEEYEKVINAIRCGFTLDGVKVRPNPRIATICIVESCLGLRLGDVLKLRMTDFIYDSGRWRLDIKEQKTGKSRTFTVPDEIYNFIQSWAYNNNINKKAKLFDVCERQVELHLNKALKYTGIPVGSHGSHSFRKMFATSVYNENNHDIELVRILLQHSSVNISQRYLGVSQERVEQAIEKTVTNLI